MSFREALGDQMCPKFCMGELAASAEDVSDDDYEDEDEDFNERDYSTIRVLRVEKQTLRNQW